MKENDGNVKCKLLTLTIMIHVYCTFLVYIVINCWAEHDKNKDRESGGFYLRLARQNEKEKMLGKAIFFFFFFLCKWLSKMYVIDSFLDWLFKH